VSQHPYLAGMIIVRNCAFAQPDRNIKLSPNSLQNITKLNKNLANFWKWSYLYQNINFFTEDQSLKAFYLSPCILPDSV